MQFPDAALMRNSTHVDRIQTAGPFDSKVKLCSPLMALKPGADPSQQTKKALEDFLYARLPANLKLSRLRDTSTDGW